MTKSQPKLRKRDSLEKKAKQITKKRIEDGILQYFVKWQGEQDGDWVPFQLLTNALQLIKYFQKEYKIKKRRNMFKRITLLNIRQQLLSGKIQPDLNDISAAYQQNVEKLQAQEVSSIQEDEGLFKEEEEHKERYQQKLDDVREEPTLKKEQGAEQLEEGDEYIVEERFDCLTGEWVDVAYTPAQIKQIQELREDLAFKKEMDHVKIINICQRNKLQIVQFQRNGKKCQCEMQDFSDNYAQILIDFIMAEYDPVNHEVINEEREIRHWLNTVQQRIDEHRQKRLAERKIPQ